ncbi:MAG: flagellar biosynthesis protein FlhA [Actinomycetes bacterium]|jgi:flagellar biosynthesis protein FlhA
MKLTKAVVPLFLVAAILMMVVPVSPVFLDLMLGANLALAVLILLGTILLKDSLDFSVFPSLLLITTLLRLALNVSSTRLILLEGYAGKVIETFGQFVVGGSVVVGLVVFFILVVIQFVVITNGAGRVAEVGARFTLDAMPGKQMAIDADLTAGLIDEGQARELRARIAREADFYGAMDGASKFVKGDAIAGLIITAINLFGGFAVGLGMKGMSLEEAIQNYSLLTVGDGLVSQLPALLISVSTGLLVTRVRSEEDLSGELAEQLFNRPKAMRLSSYLVGGLAFLPGLPTVTFLSIAGVLFAASGKAAARPERDQAKKGDEPVVSVSPDSPEALLPGMRVEPLELHLAYDILDLIDAERGGDLLDRVRALRGQIAQELGFVMPYVRTRDDVTLPPSTYQILLRGVEVARGTVPRDRLLAIPTADESAVASLGGEETTEPVFGLTAYWLPVEQRAAAIAAGATVVDRSSVIVTHLAEVVRTNAALLLSRQDVQELTESLRQDEPILASEVGSERLPLGMFHQVLRSLLDERVPIRDLGRIIEALTSRPGLQTVDQMVNAARAALGRTIVSRIAPEGRLGVITLEPQLEAVLHEALREVDGEVLLVPDPQTMHDLVSRLGAVLAEKGAGQTAVVCAQALRRPLRNALRAAGIDIPVVAYPEIPASVTVEPKGVIEHAAIAH